MEHEHHQWLADVNEDIVTQYERDQDMARQPKSIQRTGHKVESRWDGILRDWLPPQYEIGKRKYLLLETDDGPPVTKETDVVIFHPHYPEKLRVKESVLASGVAAAFSVKRTINREEIAEAYRDGVALRRGMKIRGGTYQQYLIPPIFFGLLGESHGWKAPESTPKENIRSVLDEFDRNVTDSPREGLDFLCVADLGTWSKVTAVLPGAFLKRNPHITGVLAAATGTSGTESLVMSGLRHDYEEQKLSPLTNFIGALWDKLATNDPTLKPLADGLRITKTTNWKGSFGGKIYTLDSATTPEIARSLRHHPEPFSL